MRAYGSKRASRPFEQIHNPHRCRQCAEHNRVPTKARRSVEKRAAQKDIAEDGAKAAGK